MTQGSASDWLDVALRYRDSDWPAHAEGGSVRFAAVWAGSWVPDLLGGFAGLALRSSGQLPQRTKSVVDEEGACGGSEGSQKPASRALPQSSRVG